MMHQLDWEENLSLLSFLIVQQTPLTQTQPPPDSSSNSFTGFLSSLTAAVEMEDSRASVTLLVSGESMNPVIPMASTPILLPLLLAVVLIAFVLSVVMELWTRMNLATTEPSTAIPLLVPAVLTAVFLLVVTELLIQMKSVMTEIMITLTDAPPSVNQSAVMESWMTSLSNVITVILTVTLHQMLAVPSVVTLSVVIMLLTMESNVITEPGLEIIQHNADSIVLLPSAVTELLILMNNVMMELKTDQMVSALLLVLPTVVMVSDNLVRSVMMEH
jgi:hypothetical protein